MCTSKHTALHAFLSLASRKPPLAKTEAFQTLIRFTESHVKDSKG